ncbi:hypothetical protein PF008_g7435 [Phytophthora fragariae]|uniref:Uncharacterized protein n=1 Tax=Phytophthora fragariae TaxID=53985 RepID=A0A6G0S438_9STRA|nr:hypothetical protein PF008_g7435 [Phytophthora fragariae]
MHHTLMNLVMIMVLAGQLPHNCLGNPALYTSYILSGIPRKLKPSIITTNSCYHPLARSHKE